MKRYMIRFGFVLACMAAVFVFNSCDEDAFSQVIEIDIPEHDPVLVVSCEIQAGAPLIEALVSHSLGILDTSQFSIVENAEVVLQKDAMTFPLEFNPLTRRYEHLTGQPFELPSGEYNLHVSAPGYSDISSSQHAPTPVEITEMRFEAEGAILSDGDRGHEVEVVWSDPPGEANYYSLVIYTQSNSGGVRRYLETLDPTIEYGIEDELLIDDTSFDGRQFTARVAFDTYHEDFLMPGGRIYAFLRPVTRDGYLYSRSRNLYEYNRDNPFAEPVVVHSNIENGYGIFSLSQISEAYVEF